MIVVIQRVTEGKVLINNSIFSEIKNGYVILLGIFQQDTIKDIDKLIEKIINLRIMSDRPGKMNLSILETKGEILLIPQFTLCANLKGGRRPDFYPAKNHTEAKHLYELFIKRLQYKNISVKTGDFGANMEVQIFNDGPVTFILDSKNIQSS